MNVQAITPVLNVSSLEQSFAWFGKLGWRKCWDWGDPPQFGAVGSGQVEIFLCLRGQGARGDPMPRGPWDDETGTWTTWWLETPADVDRTHALALQHGLVVTWPPTDMPWNVRECHLRHPDGHTFRVSCGLEEDA